MVRGRAKGLWGAALLGAAMAVSAGALGCGGAMGAGEGAADPELNVGKAPPFPSAGALTEIGKKPAPKTVFRPDSVEVSDFHLVGLPDNIDSTPIDPAGPWDHELLDVAGAQAEAVLLTKAMQCVAHNTALFRLDHGNFPSRPARRAIASRCGSPLGDYLIFVQGFTHVPKTDTEEKIFERSKADLHKSLEKLLSKGNLNAGLWYEHRDDTVIVVGVAQPRTAALESTPIVADEKHQWRLRGRLLSPARSVHAMINRGPYGVADCDVDHTVALPDFAIQCELDPGDASAWLNVVAIAPDRVLGEVAIEMKVHAQGALNDSYVVPSLPDDVKSPGGELDASITALVNAMRAKAGYGPLSLEVKQSATAAQVAPHYFASMDGAEDPAVSDTVALGMIAGWDVKGDVHKGDFVSLALYGSQDARALVAEALRAPITRRALLSPKIERVAIGTAVQDDNVGVLVGTYEMSKPVAYDVLRVAVTRRLNEQRAAAKMPPAVVLNGLDAEGAKIADDIAKGAPAGRSLQALMQRTTDTYAQSSRGFAMITTSIEDMKLPDEIVKKSDLKVAISVAPYRPLGSPWVMDLVMIAFLVGEPTQSASAEVRDGPRSF